MSGTTLEPRSPTPAADALESIRREIDRLDERLLDLLAERQRLAVSTLAAKESAGLPSTDVSREAAVVSRSARLARERGLEPELVRDVFWRLIELSRIGQRAGCPADRP